SDGNGSHASTLKSPSYTKSVSWQHYPLICRSDLDANLALRNHLNTAKQSMINSIKQSESLAH
ncbi:hypothetical protein PND88_25620, partial [Klebsiella pneumoniae]|nr:hypothetical protein [Klebsiella pneumoniae]